MCRIKESNERRLPDRIRDDVLDSIKKWSWLIPPYVREVYVYGAYESNNFPMVCSVDMSYMFLSIEVGHPAFSYTKEKIEECVRHELCHCYTSPIADAARMAIGRLNIPGELQEIINGNISEKLEMATEALSLVLEERFNGEDGQG